MIRLRIGHSSRMHNTWCKEIKHDGEGERWEVKIGQMIGSIWWKGQEWKKALKGDFYCSNYNADDSQGVQEASYDNSVDRCYAMPVYNPVLQLLWGGRVPTSRWAGPPAAGSGPSWEGWIQSRHCYCASGLLKLAERQKRRGGRQRGRDGYKQTEVRRGAGAGVT